MSGMHSLYSQAECGVQNLRQITGMRILVFWYSGSGIPETGHLGSGKDIMPIASVLRAWALSQVSGLSASFTSCQVYDLRKFLNFFVLDTSVS